MTITFRSTQFVYVPSANSVCNYPTSLVEHRQSAWSFDCCGENISRWFVARFLFETRSPTAISRVQTGSLVQAAAAVPDCRSVYLLNRAQKFAHPLLLLVVTNTKEVRQWLCGRVPDLLRWAHSPSGMPAVQLRIKFSLSLVIGRLKVRIYFSPRSTQPSIPPGSVNEYLLLLGRRRRIWLIPLADETQGVQVKLCYLLTMRAIPEHLRDVSYIGAIQIDINLYLYLIAAEFPAKYTRTDKGTIFLTLTISIW